MKLTLDKYTVSKETLELVLNALGNNWFCSIDDGNGNADIDNNEDIIEADKRLQQELARQEPDQKL